MNRTAVTAGVLALVLAQAQLAASAAGDALTIKVAASSNDTATEVYYAKELGFFKKRNLDVQVQTMQNGAAEAAAVAGGAVDIGEQNLVSGSSAHVRGIPFVFIAPAALYDTHAPTTLLVVGKTSAIHSAADLNNKTIAVSALRDLTQLSTAAWITKNHGDVSTVKFIEMPTSEMGAAIRRGTVDGATIPEPALQIALADARVLGKPMDAIAERFVLNGWFTTDTWLKKNPDAASRFVAAIVEAGRWANRNHKASAEIFKRYSKAQPEIIDVMTRATFAEKFTPEVVQPVIDTAVRGKLFDKSFPAVELYASPAS